ncbi:MAG TPA: hypothetical protein PLL18_05125, partial [Flavobacteriales bacterium]|nr:hypothetical protein [Flavobacteriales bacterium]
SLRRNNKVYLGSPWKVYARYRYQYRRDLDFGITAEKDEGEEFFKGTQKKGFDFYSAHLFLRNVGPFKAVALGDYQAQFGQGLTFSSGLSFARKSAYSINIERNAQGLMPYASVNENQFLRGAAATMGLGKRFEGTAFISRKKHDANLRSEADTSFSGSDADLVTFSSFQEDGYHRTYSELDKKNALEEFVYGGHLRYRGTRLQVGATAARVDFGHALAKSSTVPYNQFEFQGQSNTTYGMDWKLPYRNLIWFGEVARSADGGSAGVTGLLAALDKRLSMALLYRNLQRNFHGPRVLGRFTTCVACTAVPSPRVPTHGMSTACTPASRSSPTGNGSSTPTSTSSPSRGCATRPTPPARVPKYWASSLGPPRAECSST